MSGSSTKSDIERLAARCLPQQQRFADYLVGKAEGKTVLAASLAGYKHPAKAAYRLQRNPRVQAYIEALTLESRKKHQLTADRVIQELSAMAFGNLMDICEWQDGTLVLKPSAQLDHKAMAMVASVNHTVDIEGRERVEVKLWDKPRSIRMAMDYLKLFEKEKGEEKADLEDAITRAVERANQRQQS